MKRFGWVLSVTLLAALSLGGCKSLLKKRDSVTTEASAAASVAPPAVSQVAPPPTAVASVAPPPAENDDLVPTSQDFEDEAFEKVTAANFKTELARLKKEIEKK